MIQSFGPLVLAVQNQRTEVTNSWLSRSKAATQKRDRKDSEDSSPLPNTHSQIPKLGKDSIGWRIERQEMTGVLEWSLDTKQFTWAILCGIEYHVD